LGDGSSGCLLGCSSRESFLSSRNSFRHVVHTVQVLGTKLGDEIEEQSWRESWGANWTPEFDFHHNF
jgi:hypothetical protein